MSDLNVALTSLMQEMTKQMEAMTKTISDLSTSISMLHAAKSDNRDELYIRKLKELAATKQFGGDFVWILKNMNMKFYIDEDFILMTENEMKEGMPKGISASAVTLPNETYDVVHSQCGTISSSGIVIKGSSTIVRTMCEEKCTGECGICNSTDDELKELLRAMNQTKNLFYVHPELMLQANYFSHHCKTTQ
jgi:hypothetical protein